MSGRGPARLPAAQSTAFSGRTSAAPARRNFAASISGVTPHAWQARPATAGNKGLRRNQTGLRPQRLGSSLVSTWAGETMPRTPGRKRLHLPLRGERHLHGNGRRGR